MDSIREPLSEGEQVAICKRLYEGGDTNDVIATTLNRSLLWVVYAIDLFNKDPDLAAMVIRNDFALTVAMNLRTYPKIVREQMIVKAKRMALHEAMSRMPKHRSWRNLWRFWDWHRNPSKE